MKRKIANLLFVVLLILSITACGNKVETNKEEKKNVEASNNKEMYQEYYRILENNKREISNYNWQLDKNDKPISKPTALCDINGDNIPELFYMSLEEMSEGVLHIYTYKDKKATEITYENFSVGTEESQGFRDINVAGGTKYVVYTSKEKNKFYICSSMGDTKYWFAINEYEVDKEGLLKRSNLVVNVYDYTYGLGTTQGVKDQYLINGKEVSEEEGVAAFVKAEKNLNQVIMYSSNEKDISVWAKIIEGQEKAMSYEDMINYLDKQIDGEKEIDSKESKEESLFNEIISEHKNQGEKSDTSYFEYAYSNVKLKNATQKALLIWIFDSQHKYGETTKIFTIEKNKAEEQKSLYGKITYVSEDLNYLCAVGGAEGEMTVYKATDEKGYVEEEKYTTYYENPEETIAKIKAKYDIDFKEVTYKEQ